MFDNETLVIYRDYVTIHMDLNPYLLSAGTEAYSQVIYNRIKKKFNCLSQFSALKINSTNYSLKKLASLFIFISISLLRRIYLYR